jgi:hypothetical protein
MSRKTNKKVRAGITITPDGLMKMAISDGNPSRERIKMIENVRDYVSNSDAQNDGVVIAVKEKEQRHEVPALIAEIGLTNKQYAVRTSGDGSEELNSLGRQDHTNALILFTTQSQPDDADLWDCWDEKLDEDPSFMFRGKPRYPRFSKELGMMIDPMTAKEFLEAHSTDLSLQKVTPEGLLQVARKHEHIYGLMKPDGTFAGSVGIRQKSDGKWYLTSRGRVPGKGLVVFTSPPLFDSRKAAYSSLADFAAKQGYTLETKGPTFIMPSPGEARSTDLDEWLMKTADDQKRSFKSHEDGVLQMTTFVVDMGYLNVWFTKEGKMLKLTYPGIEKDIAEGLSRVVSPTEADKAKHKDHSAARTEADKTRAA